MTLRACLRTTPLQGGSQNPTKNGSFSAVPMFRMLYEQVLLEGCVSHAARSAFEWGDAAEEVFPESTDKPD